MKSSLSPEQKSKGQAAIEYMMIFGIAILLSTPFIAKAQNSILELRTSSELVDVETSADKLERALETVNAAGPPARRTFSIKVPGIVERTFVEERSISMNVRTSEGASNITRSFDFNITGTIPQSEGAHRISVSAKSDRVEIEEVS